MDRRFAAGKASAEDDDFIGDLILLFIIIIYDNDILSVAQAGNRRYQRFRTDSDDDRINI